MAEAFNSLYKAELSFLEGLWRDRAQLEAATADWVHWFNIERLHSMLVYQTPAEVESNHYSTDAQTPVAA